MSADLPQWSDEAVAESFRAEIRARFEAHNAAFRASERADLDRHCRAHPEVPPIASYEIPDSLEWSVYQASEIRIDRNSVTVVLPIGIAIGIDLIYMFDHTTVAWGRPSIGATIVDGEPRPTIEILLVATWNDAMNAAQRHDDADRKRVLVELFEDEVRVLADFIGLHADPLSDLEPDPARRLLVTRDRLKLALPVEPIGPVDPVVAP